MFEELERQHAERARHAENSARLAQAFAKYESTGLGTLQFEEAVNFGLTFIEEPYVTYGGQVDLDALGELLGIEAGEVPPLPQVTGFVTEWDQDDRDYYTGAWVAVSIAYPTGTTVGDPPVAIPGDLKIYLNHHFTFTAIAIKDVPIDLRD